MSCAECFRDLKDQQKALTAITTKAKQYAEEHKTTVFIYMGVDQFHYIEERHAKEQGIYPTHGIVSYSR